MAKHQRAHSSRWDGLAPEYVLLGGILRQAVRDAEQTSNERLQVEAFEFLQVCAPTVAGKVKSRIDPTFKAAKVTDLWQVNLT